MKKIIPIMKKRIFAILIALALLLNVSFAAAEAQPAEETAELFGSPWINSTVIGNLPEEAPASKDDFYASVNYDILAAANQAGAFYSPIQTGSAELQTALIPLIAEEKATGNDLAQLKIFWEQAADMDALRETGYSQIDPYLQRIDEVNSIEELNAVLTADDFPFSPYLVMPTAPLSLNEENGVRIYPALSLSEDYMNSANFYTEPVEDAALVSQKIGSMDRAIYSGTSLYILGVPQEELTETLATLYNMEVRYVSKAYSEAKAVLEDYGYIADAPRRLSMEELDALCSSFPLAATLKKFGKDQSSAFVVPEAEWLQALDELWKEENLESLRLLTRFKVLMEVAPFLDQDSYNFVRNASGQPVMDADTNPWNVCNQATTFGSLLAKLYTEQVLGNGKKEKLTAITQGLVNEYRNLINGTEWLSEESREKAIEKLDNMRLNILEPDGGYTDYSGLKLIPSTEGGTLFDNYLILKAYMNEQENGRIGKPAVADMCWKVVNPTAANCFYDPFSNSINIYPGFVNSYSYPDHASDAELAGGMGIVIAHEISHGFDFAGSQCDAFGLGNPILGEEDLETFLGKVKAVEEYYNGITFLPDMNCRGDFLRVENTSDLVGLKAAVRFVKSKGLDLETFFRANAAFYVTAMPVQIAQLYAMMDSHAPSYLRVNVNVQMMDEFYDTFDVQEGDGMYVKPEERLNIWGGAEETVEVSALIEQAQAALETGDYETAVPLLQEVADLGEAPACYYLGFCFENGLGAEQDEKKALEYYQLAADQGIDAAQYKLGVMYQLGQGVEPDYEKAFHYYSLAAEQDYPEALTAVGYFYGQGLGTAQNLDEMLKYYQMAVERGESMAQFNLGCCYRDGTGVEQDYGKMLEYFRLAVDQGNAHAQFNLGFAYYVGQGVEPDYDEAFRLYQLAADQEFPVAMFAVGDCYYLGSGVEKDLEAAAEWYRKSLDAGYEPDETDRAHLKDVLGETFE